MATMQIMDKQKKKPKEDTALIKWPLVIGIIGLLIALIIVHFSNDGAKASGHNGWSAKVRGYNLEKGVDMLCLTRKTNESIIIGDDVMVTIVDVRGDKVRLG